MHVERDNFSGDKMDKHFGGCLRLQLQRIKILRAVSSHGSWGIQITSGRSICSLDGSAIKLGQVNRAIRPAARKHRIQGWTSESEDHFRPGGHGSRAEFRSATFLHVMNCSFHRNARVPRRSRMTKPFGYILYRAAGRFPRNVPLRYFTNR